MFKNIFDNKIGERLTTINTSSKSAMEWMGKYTQQINITDKIQQINESQLLKNPISTQVAAAATSLAQNNTIINNINNNINPNANPNSNNNNQSELENSMSSNSLSNNINTNLNNNNKISQKEAEILSKAIETNTTQETENKPKKSEPIFNIFNKANKTDPSQQQQPQQKEQMQSTQNGTEDNIDYEQHLKKVSEEVMNNQPTKANNEKKSKGRRNSASHSNGIDDVDYYITARALLSRQSTEMTSSFPSKAFHGKLNSQTIEIPGLNVKVVRYKNIENDIGKIDPNLYRNYSSSKGADANAASSKGKLFFSLRYNEDIGSFSVNINKAEIDKGSGGAQTSSGSTLSLHNRASFRQSLSTPNSPQVSRMDTYVKIQLLPDKKRKYQTKIQRKTSNPVFEETFYFATPFNELQNRTLYLAVYEFGRFLKHELIGAIRINELHLIKDINTQDVEFIRNLQNLAEVNNFFKCIFFKCQQKPIIMFLRNVFRY